MAPKQEFSLGQRVRVIVNERNRTARAGVVANVVWHGKDGCYNYYLVVHGKKVSKRYLARDLLPEQDD